MSCISLQSSQRTSEVQSAQPQQAGDAERKKATSTRVAVLNCAYGLVQTRARTGEPWSRPDSRAPPPRRSFSGYDRFFSGYALHPPGPPRATVSKVVPTRIQHHRATLPRHHRPPRPGRVTRRSGIAHTPRYSDEVRYCTYRPLDAPYLQAGNDAEHLKARAPRTPARGAGRSWVQAR